MLAQGLKSAEKAAEISAVPFLKGSIALALSVAECAQASMKFYGVLTGFSHSSGLQIQQRGTKSHRPELRNTDGKDYGPSQAGR